MIPRKFRILNPKNSRIIEVCIFFLKKVSCFLMYSIVSVCKQTFRISKVCISPKMKSAVVQNPRYPIFYMKGNVL